MQIKPLRNRVWIEKDTPPDSTAGGLILPEPIRERPTTGTVLAVGPGCRTANQFLPVEVSVGQKVLFGRWQGVNAQVDGLEVFVIPCSEILAVLE